MKPLQPFAAQWAELNVLLDTALSLPATEREAWLAGLQGEATSHVAALRSLLAHQAEVQRAGFLESLPWLPPSPQLVGQSPAPGSHIGGYQLIEEIGRGGMGTVWLAERSDGLVRRRVALKLPRIAWGDALAERLAREREILASLSHPHIARLYDAGVDAQGRPFLAMEHVQGQALDRYCTEHALSLRERVRLLLQVMSAVAHAHARLVVHRDLKPGNILVSADGQTRRVILLDFGIAKLLDGGLTQATELTEHAGRALTLDYASPEQIRGEPLGTASDIYSMAVVAFEVLAGAKPYRLKRGSAAELEEAIASAEAPPASSVVADAAQRKALRGDLDAILNRALKKSPAERYPTMEAFAQDLRRWLDGEPVQAQPDSRRYRLTKFMQRNRLQVAAAGAVMVALVAGTSVALWQAHEARLSAQQATAEANKTRIEAATAKAVQAFLESVFNANSKYQADPQKAGATTARELLDRGAERIATDLASEPEAQLRLYYVLGEMYGGMWEFERALGLFRHAHALGTQLHGPSSEPALSAAAAMGHILDDLGRRDEALAILQKADADAARRTADRDAVRVQIDAGLARLYLRREVSPALERARHAAAISRALGPSPEGIDALQILGEVARTADQLEEAREALDQALTWTEQLGALGVQSIVLVELGKVQDRLGQAEAAESTLERAVALGEQLADPAALRNARFELGRFKVRNRMFQDYLRSAGPEVAWAKTKWRESESRQLPTLVMATHGRALVAYGDASQGLAAFDEARTMLPPEAGPALRVPLTVARAHALMSLNRMAEAGADIERTAPTMARMGERAAEDWRITRRRYLVAIGKADEALRDFQSHVPPAAPQGATLLVTLPRRLEEASLLLASGDATAARQAATNILAEVKQMPNRRFAGDAEVRLNAVIGESLLQEGKPAEALPYLRDALKLGFEDYDSARSPDIARWRKLVARAASQVKP